MQKRSIGLLCTALLMFSLCACGRLSREKTVVVLHDSVTLPPVPTPKTEANPEPTHSPAPVETAAPKTDISDWYGWWRMDHCTGDWAHMYGYYWDCCAEIGERNGRIDILLWDEDLNKETALAEAQISIVDGAFYCESGSFLDRALEPGAWEITWTRDEYGSLLHVEGTYEAVGNGGFWYEIFLRPWGSVWPGSEDEKPYYYEDWYLPLIKAGLEMPDEIG